MPDMISRWIARAAIVVSILDLEATFPALKRRCRVSEDRIKAARFDPLQAHDRLHVVQLANQIATLVINQLFIS